MIRRIELLSNFGLYRHFQGAPPLPEFSKKNLIYGWNYSGKTTLSRLFQVLADPAQGVQWPQCNFRISLNDGSFISVPQPHPHPHIRVFNRDFVARNFAQEHTATAVFILGAENVALKQRLAHLRVRKEKVTKIKEHWLGEAQAAQASIDDMGTNVAREVGTLLGDRNFRRPNIQRRTEEVRPNYSIHLLNDTMLQAKAEMVRSTNQWSQHSHLQPIDAAFGALIGDVTIKVVQSASNRAIDHIRANRDVEAWVRHGLELHENSQKCQFCDNIISEQRINELRGHFSREYEQLVRDLETLNDRCKAFSCSTTIPDLRDIAPDQKAGFMDLMVQLAAWIQWAEQTKATLLSQLSDKLSAIDTEIRLDLDLTQLPDLGRIISELNHVLDEHNRTASQLAQTKADARIALERHFAGNLFHSGNLGQLEEYLSRSGNRQEKADQVLDLLNNKISAIEIQVQQHSIGAAKLNQLLGYLLKDNEVQAFALGSGTFEFRRNGELAQHLSDGEKTAITFAHFLTTLEENGASLANAIVFVDDPISSLDSNHIFAVFSLLSSYLEDCSQVFVSTHNSELFNLLKDDWFDARAQYRDNAEARAFYVRRKHDNAGTSFAVLEDLPPLLRKFKSEYQFVFEQLHTFGHGRSGSLHEAYTSPNLLRKFLEAYLGFKRPHVSQWSKKLDLVLDSEIEMQEIQKFADDSSHLHGLNRALQQPTYVASAQNSVKLVLDGLKQKDSEHYISMCTSVGVAP